MARGLHLVAILVAALSAPGCQSSAEADTAAPSRLLADRPKKQVYWSREEACEHGVNLMKEHATKQVKAGCEEAKDVDLCTDVALDDDGIVEELHDVYEICEYELEVESYHTGSFDFDSMVAAWADHHKVIIEALVRRALAIVKEQEKEGTLVRRTKTTTTDRSIVVEERYQACEHGVNLMKEHATKHIEAGCEETKDVHACTEAVLEDESIVVELRDLQEVCAYDLEVEELNRDSDSNEFDYDGMVAAWAERHKVIIEELVKRALETVKEQETESKLLKRFQANLPSSVTESIPQGRFVPVAAVASLAVASLALLTWGVRRARSATVSLPAEQMLKDVENTLE